MYTESSVTKRTHKDKPEVGNKIRQLRENAGLTRRDLCERLSIPYRTLQEWETGRRTPPGYVIKLLEIYIKKSRDAEIFCDRKKLYEIQDLYVKATAALGYINTRLYQYDNKDYEDAKWVHFPFKDVSMNNSGDFDYALKSENWDLPEWQVELIQEYMSLVCEYANKVCELFPKGVYAPVNLIITPERLFPWYNAGSIAWRMGFAKRYDLWFSEKISRLTENERQYIESMNPDPRVNGDIGIWRFSRGNKDG